MPSIRTDNTDGILMVTLSRGKANALNAAMLEELHGAMAQAHAPDVGGLVLASDRPKFFSGGFDVKEVFQYDRETMTSYFGSFMDLYEDLFRLPKPVVAALSGHAVAGGAVLALPHIGSCIFLIPVGNPGDFRRSESSLDAARTSAYATSACEPVVNWSRHG